MALASLIGTMFERSELMSRMIRAVGVADRMPAGAQGAHYLRSATLRCQGCAHTAACGNWLAGRSSADLAPVFCRNREIFARLGDPIGTVAP